MHITSKRTRQLEQQISDFLNTVNDAALVFEKGVGEYMSHRREDFETRAQEAAHLENRADELRRSIETELYSNTLIPESRGDVLSILENTDNVIDCIKGTFMQFSVECPDIPEEFFEGFRELAKASKDAVNELILAVHGFFEGDARVKTVLHKVHFYEKEADNVAEKIKRGIFAGRYDLALKLQLNRYVQLVEEVSDLAESVADRLAIYAIKRQI